MDRYQDDESFSPAARFSTDSKQVPQLPTMPISSDATRPELPAHRSNRCDEHNSTAAEASTWRSTGDSLLRDTIAIVLLFQPNSEQIRGPCRQPIDWQTQEQPFEPIGIWNRPDGDQSAKSYRDPKHGHDLSANPAREIERQCRG